MNESIHANREAVWEDVFQRHEWAKYPPEHVIRFVARNFYRAPRRQDVRLLDLGCGPGACSWYMAREGFAVAGIDGSPTAIQRARERLARENLTGDFRVGNYTSLPFRDAEFDGVIDNVTLYCNPFKECRQAVCEVMRVLKPGGVFLSCNFTERTWGYGLGREIEPRTFVDIPEGPLHGRGLALFMSREQVEQLYADFAERTVELSSWTDGNMEHSVELWVVTCRKQP